VCRPYEGSCRACGGRVPLGAVSALSRCGEISRLVTHGIARLGLTRTMRGSGLIFFVSRKHKHTDILFVL